MGDTNSQTNTPPNGSTQNFVNDIYSGKPILSQLVTVIATGDRNKLNTFTDNCGYKLESDVLQAAAKSNQPGPNFDIASVGGAYKFTAPADMTAKTLSINPETRKLYVSKADTNYTIDLPTGAVTFAFNGLTYSIIFTIASDDDGDPQNITFEGHRSNETASDIVTGEKLEPSDPNAWASTPAAAMACWALTLAGVFIPVLFYAVDKGIGVKQQIKEKRAARAKKALEINEARVREYKGKEIADLLKVHQPEITSFPKQVELVIEKTVSKAKAADKTDEEAMQDGVLAGAKEFENMAVSLVLPGAQRSDASTAASEKAIGTEEAKAIRRELIVENVHQCYPRLDKDSQWINFTAEAKLQKCITQEKDKQLKEMAMDIESTTAVAEIARINESALRKVADDYKRDNIDQQQLSKEEMEVRGKEWGKKLQDAQNEGVKANEAEQRLADLTKAKDDASHDKEKAEEDQRAADARAAEIAKKDFEFHGE